MRDTPTRRPLRWHKAMKCKLYASKSSWTARENALREHLDIPNGGTTGYAQPMQITNEESEYFGKWMMPVMTSGTWNTMSRDIVVFDQLSDLKRLANNEAFLHLDSVFRKERDRYLAATLDPKADSMATMQGKAVVNALDQLSPLQLVERSLKIEVKNRKIEHPEMFKIKRNGK